MELQTEVIIPENHELMRDLLKLIDYAYERLSGIPDFLDTPDDLYSPGHKNFYDQVLLAVELSSKKIFLSPTHDRQACKGFYAWSITKTDYGPFSSHNKVRHQPGFFFNSKGSTVKEAAINFNNKNSGVVIVGIVKPK